MKIDIRRYLSLRDSLLKEKSDLEVRLREISQALGKSGPSTPKTVEASATPGPGRRGRRGRRGGLSLRDAVLQVTSGTPLTKEEILQRIGGLGYRFSTKNPMNSLGVILYGRSPKFRNDNGRFSVTGTKASAGGNAIAAVPARRGARKRRTMSPEARARIAAAQRARWAKARGK